MGAPGRPLATATRPPVSGKEFRITAEDRAFWSFQPVKNPPLPAVQERCLAEERRIDRFILAKLEAKGLVPVPAADKRDLAAPGHVRPDRPAADAGRD